MKSQQLKYTLLGALLVSGTLGLASQAHAVQPASPVPGYCSSSTASGGISTADVTLNSMISNDCYGVVGGNINNAADVNGLGLTWGTNWFYLDSTNDDSATWMGFTFTVTAPLTTGGDWTLTGTDADTVALPNFPVDMDLVVVLKGSDRYALWGFDNVTVNSGANNGTFTIVFKNNGNQIPDLSHMTVFGREAGGGTIAAIPEADTYAMLLAGLGLVGFAARRKLNKTV